MTEVADAPLSTTIDPETAPNASGGGAPVLSEHVDAKPSEPASLRDDLEAVFKEEVKADAKEPPAKQESDKPELKAKDEPPVKEEQPAPEKPVEPKADATEQVPDKPSDVADKADGAKFHEPPKSFLPDSKDVWRNVPRSVRRDIETMVRTHEEAVARTQQDVERYEQIRDFDDLARSNGRDLRDSLARVHQVETLIQNNPIAGLNAILMEIGPRKADGQAVSLYEVAQFVVEQGPQGYQQMMANARQDPPQQRQSDPEVETLKSELAQMKIQQLEATVINPFKDKHPRFEELKDDIAFFLQSGKISQTLSHAERLAAAYDMAERINPSSRAPQPLTATDTSGPGTEDRRADPDFSGSKSIKSSPGSVTEEVEDRASSTESTRESLLKEMRRMNRA